MFSTPSILGLVATFLAALLSSALSGFLGTGLVNLANQTNKRRWFLWIFQLFLVAGSMISIAFLSAKNELPAPAELKNLLKKCLLEDLQREVIRPLESAASEMAAREKDGAPITSIRNVVIDVRKNIQKTVDDAHSDCRRWEETYTGRDTTGEFATTLDFLKEVQEQILADRLDGLIQRETISKADVDRLIIEAQEVVRKFKLN